VWRSADCAGWIKINDFAQGFGAPDTVVLKAANWNTSRWVRLGANNNFILAGLVDGACSTVMLVWPHSVPATRVVGGGHRMSLGYIR